MNKDVSNNQDASKEEIKNIEIDKVEGASNLQWFYAMQQARDDYGYTVNYGQVYNIDQDGNLIASLSINKYDNLEQIDGKSEISSAEKKRIMEAIDTSRKQLDFLGEQNRIKLELLDYPEINEKALQLFDPKTAVIRFKDEKTLLRAVLTSRDSDVFRFLLSIAALNKVDLFNELVDNKILCEDDFYTNIIERTLLNGCKRIYEMMLYWTKEYSKMPSIEFLVTDIGLPYSKTLFDSYLWDEEAIETWVTANYDKMKKYRFDRLIWKLSHNEQKSIDEVIESLDDIKTRYTYAKEDINNSFNNLQEYLEGKENEIRLSTGIKELDDKKFYLPKGKICSVFAYTGSFKTMFSSNVAYNIMNSGGNVLYLSLEISKSEMYINFLSRHSYNYDRKLSHSDIKANRITQDDKDYLFNTIYPDFRENLKQHLIIYDETDISSNTYETFNKLLSQADREFIKQTGTGIDLIIVDHLNLLKFGMNSKVQNDYSAVNHWMSYFRKNCIDFLGRKKQVAILCACQSSREGYKKAKKDGKYDLTSIAEGNEIERSSAYVLSLYTSENDRKNNTTKMQILKLRDEAPSEDLINVCLAPKYYTFGIESEENADIGNSPDENSVIKDNSQDVMNTFGGGSSDE